MAFLSNSHQHPIGAHIFYLAPPHHRLTTAICERRRWPLATTFALSLNSPFLSLGRLCQQSCYRVHTEEGNGPRH